MCEFCENIGIGIPDLNFCDLDEPNRSRSIEYIGIRKMFNDFTLVYSNRNTECGYALNINCCPKCGRKLSEVKNG